MIRKVEDDIQKSKVRQAVIEGLTDTSGDDYSPYFEQMGFEVLHSLRIGGYQGDFIIVLYNSDTDRFGFNSIGYGSCSGCDALLGYEFDCRFYDAEQGKYVVEGESEDLDNFADYLWRLVQRFQWYNDPSDLVEYLEDCDWQSKYLAYSMTASEDARSGFEEIDTIIKQLEPQSG